MHILYDVDAVPQFAPAWFDRDMQSGVVPAHEAEGGRAPALFFKVGTAECVLKHYRRGGWPRRFVQDAYCYTGEAAVRSFREWRLLSELRRQSLPVPVPLAARYHLRGWYYSADLITRRLHAQPLPQLLAAERLPCERWNTLGAVVRCFHDAGVYHPDLNAYNILLGSSGEIFVVDFDRARIVAGARPARFADNLKRLQHSLLKLRSRSMAFMYEDLDFDELLAGYRSG